MQWLWTLVHALVVGLVAAEPFYQRRDHLDQQQYIDMTNVNVVKDSADAKFVLYKYGYLPCHVSRRKREAVNQRRSPLIMSEGGDDTCGEGEVQKAIRNYQRTYNLPETGVLDEQTKSLMSTSRCGNKDSEKKKDDETDLEHLVDREASSEEPKTSSQRPNRLWRRSTGDIGKSKLVKLLSPADDSSARPLAWHRRYLDNYAEKLRLSAKGQRRLLHKYTPKERRKRAVQVEISDHPDMDMDGTIDTGFTRGGQYQNTDLVRWRILETGHSTRIPFIELRSTIDLAFRMWSEVIPLKFLEDTDSDIHNVQIKIAFGKLSHRACPHDFDGNGGEIAHSTAGGDMHFDDEEDFKGMDSHPGSHGIYLLRVAVHEIGHVLGLAHTNKSYSIMYAIYHGTENRVSFELDSVDRREIQKFYGKCKGHFNTIFDWVRDRGDSNFIYNTYFFRKNRYWMYENHANRTRYGDPLSIANEWQGVPDNVDGYAHIFVIHGKFLFNDIYFFKDDKYYKYDSYRDSVMNDWPKYISDDFGPKKGQNEGIPDRLDTVFFDLRDRKLYFFKNEYVYVYDPLAPEDERGCCEKKIKITQMFPSAEGETKPLPEKLDAVYYSYNDKMQYFVRGVHLWRNKLFDPRASLAENSIEYMGFWYDKWMDICDVHIES